MLKETAEMKGTSSLTWKRCHADTRRWGRGRAQLFPRASASSVGIGVEIQHNCIPQPLPRGLLVLGPDAKYSACLSD